jgi:transcriptional regulator with XRE-family HTH domain
MMEPSITWFINMSFPARLIALRKQKGLSQQAMAEAIGLHVTQIKRYESGASQPSLDAIKKIAVALSVSTDSLLFDENERGPDDDLRLQFDAVSRMPKKERQVIREVIDGMILKYETQRWHAQRASTG